MSRSIVSMALALVVIAAAAGYMLGRRALPPSLATPSTVVAASAEQPVYTCSMHPQVRMARPGKCPICGMDLVRASVEPGSAPVQLALSEQALRMASVETTLVTRQLLTGELRAVGKIRYNESSLATVTARVDGYAERLFVDFTGVEIQAGDHLAEIYSPELLVAQQELLITLQDRGVASSGALVETAKLKLRRLGLTQAQIQALVEKQKIAERVTLYSPIQGTVIEKMIVQNSSFRAGDALYRVANLDTVWVYLDVYEYDLAWVRYGQHVRILAEAFPGREFEGQVTFIQPIVSEETRTIQVPVQVQNRDHALKPGMFVSAVIRSEIAADGRSVPTGVEGKYSCPMHIQVLRDDPGACPICGMSLVEIPGATPLREPGEAPSSAAARGSDAGGAEGVLTVPRSAVLDSGSRQLVYVERSRGLFEPREVVLGPRAGGFFPVLEGLAEGERVVARGGFLIDSQFQISGQPSLFYPGGLLGAVEHEGGAAPPPRAPAPHRH